jgi:hypothetical protein
MLCEAMVDAPATGCDGDTDPVAEWLREESCTALYPGSNRGRASLSLKPAPGVFSFVRKMVPAASDAGTEVGRKLGRRASRAQPKPGALFLFRSQFAASFSRHLAGVPSPITAPPAASATRHGFRPEGLQTASGTPARPCPLSRPPQSRAFPPGRCRLSTRPDRTGSLPFANTTGMLRSRPWPPTPR